MIGNRFIWFDFCRAASAILVLISHLRALIFEDFSGSSNVLCKFFYFITGFGHQAVIFFFVLSGFFIIRNIHESSINEKWNVCEYVLNRGIRLWIVLLPALLMTLIWDRIGLLFFENSFIYSGLVQNMPNISPLDRLGFLEFIGNLFFLQTITVQTFGSNGALWSLANEFWYYLIFPLFYFTFHKYYNTRIRILLFIFGLGGLFFIGREISIYFIIWLMGGGAYFLITKKFLFERYFIIKFTGILVIFMVSLVFIRFKYCETFFNDFSLGLITSFLLCVFSKLQMRNGILMKITSTFSEMSYTVYLTHLPFSVFLVSCICTHRIQFNWINFIIYLGILFVVLLYCYLLYNLFEKRTVFTKNYVKKILSL